jgi:thiol:disulfide interchange protein DsbD
LVWVEHLFGVVLLVLAWYFLAPLLPAGVRRFGYVLLLLGAAFGLGFLDRAGQSLASFRVFKRIFGITVAAVALWLAFPQRSHSFIGWVPFSQESLAQAAQQRRPVVLDFVADWCIPCHEMDVSTFADPRVVELARDFLMLRADLTLENEYTQGVTKQFDVRGVPTLIVLDENGREVARLVGYVSADELLEAMHRARPHESQPR